MEYSGGHRGFLIRQRPRRYPRTEQQRRFSEALTFCGIEKGISKKELMEKMVTCLPQFYRKEHEVNK